MNQPTALFLADVLHNDPCSKAHHDAAAFELRRLHAENERIGPLAERVLELKAQRDALLEALRWIDQRCPQAFMDCPLHTIHREMAHDAGACARAAIKAVEGEKT